MESGPLNVRFYPNCGAKDGANRPASLWIAADFGVLRFSLMVKRGPWSRPQASEGEADICGRSALVH